MPLQRYVSSDLTHFVGRLVKARRKRYLLLRRILKAGLLRACPKPTGLGSNIYFLQKDAEKLLSMNEACAGSVVCFCDIPFGDLELHMQKYSEFGLAFSKEFLADCGASPVIYVPRFGRPSLLPYEGYRRGRVASQKVAFDHFWGLFNRIESVLPEFEATPGLKKTAVDLRRMIQFLEVHIISNFKFFDHRLPDFDKDNFYMEREWRVSHDVTFRPSDVKRVILPIEYSREFRRDFPRFDGEIIFADLPH